MIKIEIEGKTYSYKNNADEIMLDDYIKFIDIIKNTEMTNLEKTFNIILILSDIPAAILKRISINDLDKFNISFMNDIATKNTDTSSMNDKYVIEGNEYVVTNIEDMRYGQYIDIDRVVIKAGDDYVNQIDKICAMLLLPAGQSYDSSTVDDRARLLREKMSVRDLISVASFFLHKKEK